VPLSGGRYCGSIKRQFVSFRVTDGVEVLGVNQREFQVLAEVRIIEAEVLLNQGKADGAYYLAGYSVECGLKACIAKLTQQGDFPPKPDLIRNYYSHDIEKLLKTAGLTAERDADASADPDLEANWGVVKDWNEESRYVHKTQAKARELIAAITDAVHGVLPWIKQRW
jgi:HEPN domain-containing protein